MSRRHNPSDFDLEQRSCDNCDCVYCYRIRKKYEKSMQGLNTRGRMIMPVIEKDPNCSCLPCKEEKQKDFEAKIHLRSMREQEEQNKHEFISIDWLYSK